MIQFSIIVPVYNAGDYLAECVASVCRDKNRDWELILVNDGSTDGSGKLCQELAAKDSRIWVIHQQNMGPGGARNTGLHQARGEYIWFVDSDDGIVPGALELLRRAVEQFHADIYSFDFLVDRGKGQRQRVEAVTGPENRPFTLAEVPEVLRCRPATWLRLWKRSLFEKNGITFPERAFYGEDLQTTVKLFACAKSIVMLRKPLYSYLDRPGSLMNQASEQRNRHMLTAMEDITRWFEERQLRERYEPQLCGMAVEHLLLATTVRVAKANPHAPLLEEIRQFMDTRYPGWESCDYARSLTGNKKLALKLVCSRKFRTLQVLFRLKG